jgi:hypothetical protein
MSIERKSSDRRKLRAGMVFVLVVAGTAMIGWGGLAAWQAVTQNNGSTATTLGVHMSNAATVENMTPVTCTDQSAPGTCGAIFNASNITPGYSSPVGTVQITNTGTETSTFNLHLTSAVASKADSLWTSADTTLCADLQLTITDTELPPFPVYSGPLAKMPDKALATSSGAPNWGTGATDTFNFSLALPGMANTDEDSVCTAVFTWGQNGL